MKKISIGLMLISAVFSAYASSYCPQSTQVHCTGHDLPSCHANTPNWFLSGAMSVSGEVDSGLYVLVEAGDTSPALGREQGYVWCSYKNVSEEIYVNLDQGETRTLTADSSSSNWQLDGNQYLCGNYPSDHFISASQCPFKNK